MALRTIDLAKMGRRHQPGMTYEEYKAELAKPRAERRGLPPMPADMCMSPENEARFADAVLLQHQAGAAARARAWAHGRDSNCL